MRKSFKAALSLIFCFLLVSSTMLVSLAVGNISNLKATDVTAKSATITWSAASGADGYQLEYTTGSTTKTVTVKGKNTTSYKLALTPGKSYTVRVRSYDKIIKTYYGSWYKITVKAVPAKVTNFKATNLAGGTSIKFTWTKVSGATGYLVQRYSASKKAYVNCGTTTGSSLTVKGLYAGTEYKFRIAAYYKYNGKNYYGSYVNLTATPTYLAPTSLKVTKATTNSVTLSWGAVSGAKGYQIYNYNTKKYSYTTKTSVTLTGLEAGTDYKVRVRGYAKVSGKNVYGAYTSYLSLTTVTDKVANLKASNLTSTSVDISFDKAPGALGYQVFLYDYATKKETKLIKQLTTNTYSIDGLTPGSTYRIGVCTYVKNSTYHYSAKSYVYIDTPPVLEAGADTNEKDIVLEWTEVRKATLYTVERYNPGKFEWNLVKEIPVETPYGGTVKSETKMSFKDEGAGENKGYIYRVKAYNGETLINETEAEITTTGITLEKDAFSVTVNWNAPADATTYTVYKMPVVAKGVNTYYAYDFEITDSDAESYTFNLAPNQIYSYMIVANGSSSGTVALFTVKSAPLVIDSSDASKTAQLLMLVNAINKAKLYQGDVRVNVDSYAKMVLDAIYIPEETLDSLGGLGLAIKAITDNGEIAGDKLETFFKLIADEEEVGDLPETVTIEDPAPVDYYFSEGYGKNENNYTIELKKTIEPSGTKEKNYLAYLYNEHDATTWKDGFSSIKTTYYPSTGRYKIVATLKQEKFGTTTSRADARYHHGFLSVYDALGFSGEGVDNELTTLGATTITAYIDEEGRIYNYKVTAPFSTKFAANDGSSTSIGMKMSGTTTLQYKLYF